MDIRQVLNFLLSTVINITIMLVVVYILLFVSKQFYNFGLNLAKDYTETADLVEMEIEIPEGAAVSDVADILEEAGIIKSSLFFKLENLLKGNDYVFSGGTYTLNTEMDASDIVNTLLVDNSIPEDIIITIREGYSIKDIGQYLESKEIVSAEDFVYACNNSEFQFKFLANIPHRDNRLEGYLFPDTYYILPGSTPEMIINKMLTRFEEIYSKYEADAAAREMTMDEIITIASIIEKEIMVDGEREKASQVIYNRLERNQNLQMCSTVLYVIDKQRDRLLERDLQVNSPYNTYINPGLPIGPISNPGEACIAAAVSPSEGDLLYFVVKDDNTGEHVFTNSYEEFLEAKALYNQNY